MRILIKMPMLAPMSGHGCGGFHANKFRAWKKFHADPVLCQRTV
jgi:hypothetical protein